MQIIVKKYDHINRSFTGWDTPSGKLIRSKEHYERTMAEQGMVSYEQAQEIAEKARQSKIKPYKLSKKGEEIIQYAHSIKDKKGNVKLSGRAVQVLIDKKIIGKKIPSYMQLPSTYSKGA